MPNGRPNTIDVDGSTFTYDHRRQVNVMADGTLLARSLAGGSCTNTNWDSKNDDTPDTYMIK